MCAWRCCTAVGTCVCRSDKHLASDTRRGVLLLLGVPYGEETQVRPYSDWQVSTVATVGAGTVLWCFSVAVSSKVCSLVVRLSLQTNRVAMETEAPAWP
jgi:hypothetical protein